MKNVAVTRLTSIILCIVLIVTSQGITTFADEVSGNEVGVEDVISENEISDEIVSEPEEQHVDNESVSNNTEVENEKIESLEPSKGNPFTPRTEAPPTNNAWYYSNNNPFYAAGLGPGVDGSKGNCTWYAFGRAYEIVPSKYPSLSTGGASAWYGYTADGYSRGSTPKLGAIACWSDHVAVVEAINSDGTIVLSESSYGANAGILFQLRTVNGSNPYNKSGDTFKGYIYLGDFDAPVPKDTTPPSISNVKISNVTKNGYRVTCTATDGSGIARVQFPTWTVNAGQDDLASNWDTNSAVSGAKNGNNYTFDVDIGAHNFEGGTYATHIYAFDTCGNNKCYEINSIEVHTDYVPVKTIVDGSHIYSVYDFPTAWSNAKAICEELGGHLATIATDEEKAVVKQLLGSGGKTNYYIGSQSENVGTQSLAMKKDGSISSIADSYNKSNGFIMEDEVNTNPTITKAYNNNLYQGFSKKISWHSAKAYCESIGGHLATITSQTEQSALAGIYGMGNCHLGARRGSNGSWSWITGEGWSYTKWGSSQPDNACKRENFLGTYSAQGEWNDFPSYALGFICEFDNVLTENTCSITMPSSASIILSEATTKQLTPTVNTSYPIGIDRWTSSNTNIATVDKNGLITALTEGEVTITAYITDTIFAECKVKILAEKKKYVVTFDSQGGSAVAMIRNVPEGTTITLPQPPTKEGHIFLGWYTKPNGEGTVLSEKTKITDVMTVYAYWQANEQIPNGLWVREVETPTYTGSPVKPKAFVYDGDLVLIKGVDYTLTYENNTKAADATVANAPTVTIKGKGKYQNSVTKTFTILAKSIESDDISMTIKDMTRTGLPVQSKPVIKWNDNKLVENRDYTLRYSEDLISAGEVEVVVSGIGNYTGTRTIQYRITDQMINKATIATISKQIYTGRKIEPELTVTIGSGTATVTLQPYNEQTGEGDYTAVYENNVNTGTAKVMITGKGAYGGTKTAKFTIGKKSLVTDDITIDPITEQTYSRSKLKPAITVRYGANTLQANRDYSITYSNNTKVAKADAKKAPTVVITGKGNYSGTKRTTFTIAAKSINDAGITATAADMVYDNGKERKATVIVKDGNKTLKKNTDYTVAYTNNREIGTATAVITGIKNYSGETSITYRITDKSIRKAVAVAIAPIVFDGSAKTPPVTVTFGGGIQLIQGTDYMVAYENNINAGTARAVLRGIGAYGGTKIVTFTILAKSMDNVGITVAAVNDQIYTGGAIKPELQVKDGTVDLAKGVDYTLKYSNNVKTGLAKVKIVGKGNYRGTKNTTFRIVSKSISDGSVTVNVPEVKYNANKALKPTVTVKDGKKKLTLNKDYQVSYINNVVVAEKEATLPPTVVIVGKGNYSNSRNETFRIYATAMKQAKVTAIPKQCYTGREIKPTVTLAYNNVPLQEGVDYTVSYQKNVGVGKAKAVITGKGRFGGTKTVTFTIYPKWLSWALN